MTVTTTTTGRRHALDVDGTLVPALRSFSGVGLQADIAQNTLGPQSTPKKHVTAVRCTPVRVSTGLDIGKGLYTWLNAALDGRTTTTRGGTLKRGDINGKVQSTHKFGNAVITEFTVPRLDAASRDVGHFEFAIVPGQMDWSAPGGETLPTMVGSRAKAWQLSNFKVVIGNLPCSRISAVESITWSASVATDPIGTGRVPTPTVSKVTVSDLKLSITTADMGPWADAARRWFIEGRQQESDEMSGRITLMGPTFTEELATIELGNVGFKSFAFPDAVGSSDQIERFTVELYVERLRLVIPDLED